MHMNRSHIWFPHNYKWNSFCAVIANSLKGGNQMLKVFFLNSFQELLLLLPVHPFHVFNKFQTSFSSSLFLLFVLWSIQSSKYNVAIKKLHKSYHGSAATFSYKYTQHVQNVVVNI